MNATIISPFNLQKKTIGFRFKKDDEPKPGAVVQSDNSDFFKIEQILQRNASFEKGCFLATCVVEKIN